MALEYDTEKLYDLYKNDPKIKGYVDSLPQEQWLPELQKIYDKKDGVSKEQPKTSGVKPEKKPVINIPGNAKTYLSVGAAAALLLYLL